MKDGNAIYFAKEHDMVRRAVSDFIKKEINPHVDQWEEDGIAPLKEIFKKMGDLGFLGIRYDPQYGGHPQLCTGGSCPQFAILIKMSNLPVKPRLGLKILIITDSGCKTGQMCRG